MSMAVVKSKSVEQELQNVLYENIRLITNFYPTTKEFDLVFKKDMFAKNNKSGFFQVVYYLLVTLNPTLTKTRISIWPIFDLKTESKFRSELLNYVNELNSIYETANIPPVMASQLISPSGYRFLSFMLKLSELVIVEHLSRNNVEFLKPIHVNTDDSFNENYIKCIQKKTEALEMETSKNIQKFKQQSSELSQEACNIISQLDKFEFEVKQLKNDLKILKTEHSTETEATLTEKFHKLIKNSKTLRQVRTFLEESSVLLDSLSKGPIILESDPQKEVDLIEYINQLSVSINKMNLELPNPLKSTLAKQMEELDALTGKLVVYQKLFQEYKQKLSLISNNINN